jgi:hypothetical protein
MKRLLRWTIDSLLLCACWAPLWASSVLAQGLADGTAFMASLMHGVSVAIVAWSASTILLALLRSGLRTADLPTQLAVVVNCLPQRAAIYAAAYPPLALLVMDWPVLLPTAIGAAVGGLAGTGLLYSDRYA